MSTWTPKLPKGQDSTEFFDWMVQSDPLEARRMTSNCECGVDVTYGNKEGVEYWHSFYCPKYKEKPKDEGKK